MKTNKKDVSSCLSNCSILSSAPSPNWSPLLLSAFTKTSNLFFPFRFTLMQHNNSEGHFNQQGTFDSFPFFDIRSQSDGCLQSQLLTAACVRVRLCSKVQNRQKATAELWRSFWAAVHLSLIYFYCFLSGSSSPDGGKAEQHQALNS